MGKTIKRLRKPTRKQKLLIEASGLNWENWNVLDEDKISLSVVSKNSGRKRILLK